MAGYVGMTDFAAYVSFGDSLEADPIDLSNSKSPKISRQQSRIGFVTPSTTGEGRRINDLEMTEKEKQELMHTKTFRRVQQDIKDRQKRQRMRAEKENKPASNVRQFEQQFYVDKDKQIVCAQGMR